MCKLKVCVVQQNLMKHSVNCTREYSLAKIFPYISSISVIIQRGLRHLGNVFSFFTTQTLQEFNCMSVYDLMAACQLNLIETIIIIIVRRLSADSFNTSTYT